MNAAAIHLSTKQQQLKEFLEFHSRRLKPRDRRTDLKLYYYELPEELEMIQYNHFLIDNDVYKEDQGTFQIILDYLKKHFSTPSISDADYILIPFNFQFYRQIQNGSIDQVMRNARKLARGQKFILFSFGDFCMKSANRSTTFEKQLFNHANNTNEYAPACIQPEDIFITFESTLDFIYSDIPVFPLIQTDPIDPFASAKEYLFSFVGAYYKGGWPEGFVRSPSRKEIWENLQKQPEGLIVVSNPANGSGGQNNPFYEIPQKSTFTLCPRGIASWSFRVFESILAGSVPVILSDSYTRPFPDQIPWDLFSITYPEQYLSNVGEFLKGIQPDVVHSLRRNLQKNQHWFTVNGLVNLILYKLQQKLN
jgi:hypothetical protein